MSVEFFDDDDRSVLVTDEELRQIIEKLRVKIKVFGAGGAGSNTVDRLFNDNLTGVELIAANTDARHLLRKKAHHKIILGKNLTRGLGSGANPQIGEQAAREADAEIMKYISGADIVFVAAGLGGGTGTGSAPYIASRAREAGALAISVVTLPFSSEGAVRMNNAKWGLTKLLSASDCVLVIPNDSLASVSPDTELDKAFRFVDEVIERTIKGISELVTKPGVINLDFNDLKTVVRDSGLAMVGIGQATGEPGDRIRQAIEAAFNFPYLKVDMKTATGVIINVTGGLDMILEEVNATAEEVRKKVGKGTRIILGATLDKEMNGKIQVLIVATGVTSPLLAEMNITPNSKGPGLDFIN
ncbi:cell division protein FtsZ [Thermogymnomonas acidicola]|uniref:Cell division protein FtsZ n=1 Tax=Thermogymnomonas acidicola TaxID=399579 RepID=A0AA37BRG6_9ARCH|nr:cell division protein FtsZ [Thermogymnomonas acidicola]GGM74641.1 cell division protein FtsZ [Thermogymnomonas acidicola]